MIYLILLLVTILRAVEDGLWERKLKTWSKYTEPVYLLSMIFLAAFYRHTILQFHSWPMAFENIKYLTTVAVLMVFINIAFFDVIMHLVSGWKANYVGTTSPGWDDLMKRFENWQFWVFRLSFLALSLFWYFMVVKNY